jgi:DNA-binding LytR/AlgR family response regulator
MKNKCIIVDDEPLAIEVIENHLSHFDEIEIGGKFNNAMEAFSFIKSENVDLMFLDIQMPHLTGVEFLRSLMNPPKVIFTTAYREYALEGFELDVIDYLLKPISFERFLKAMNKYYESVNSVKEHPANITNNQRKFIYVKADKKTQKIFLDEIFFVQSIKDYIQIHSPNRKIITKIPIGKFEDELPKDEFIRIHKSFIVATDKIDSFSSEVIDVRGKELPIGRTYKDTVNSRLTR